jgi:predicted unusual protein kinase regulating ubiquinone biosynthesis (AarF/ABC1/UbiB family)
MSDTTASPARRRVASPSGIAPTTSDDASPFGRLGRRIRFSLRTRGIEAVARLGAALAWGALDLALGRLLDGRGPAREHRRDQRIERSAQRLVAALGALKGAYAKAGQFAAMRHDLLPEAAGPVLATLHDRVAPLPFEAIRETVEAELGAPIETCFSCFDRVSVGAASVAQVHRARLLDGTDVAVKVQYPWLREALASDVSVLRWLVSTLCRLAGRPLPDLDRVLEEFAAGLAEELDFEREADIAEEIAANLASDPQIVVPAIVREHTRKRLLTMHFHDALPLDDPEALRAAGIEPKAILEVLGRAYAKQVFVDGLFHADPHPGNLFALPGSPPRVLFVDFGLSKRLDPALRREMRLGIYAVLQRDLDGFVERMDGMGMIAPGAHDTVRQAVAAMFERIAEKSDGRGALAVGGSQVLALKDEAKTLLQETPGLQLPNDLLLYAKTLAYLFALGDALDPEVDLLQLSLPYLLRFLAAKD